MTAVRPRWRVFVGRSTGAWIAARVGDPKTARPFMSHADALAYADRQELEDVGDATCRRVPG